MEFTLRWFGPEDPVPLAHIRQIPGVESVATALGDVTPGEAWAAEAIRARKQLLAEHGLRWSVVESVPVPEAVKLGAPERDAAIDAFATSIRRLGAAGVRTVCYNFMPVVDWMRTEFARPLPDGSNSMAYEEAALSAIDVSRGLPRLVAWARGYSGPELRALFDRYAEIDEVELLEHYAYFVRAVAPAAEEAGVRLAIHPDDPPWPIFGVPRIVTSPAAISELLALSRSPSHGLTFCTGALGALAPHDLPAMARAFGSRIHFVHARNVRRTGARDFHETAHPPECGDVDLREVMLALVEGGFDGPLRPDHGRMIWGERGIPGYGLHDRALGLSYLRGLYDGIRVGAPEAAGQTL